MDRMPRNPMPRWSALALSLGCLLSTSVPAEVYKWTDAEGRIHYGDRPQDTSATAVPIESTPPADPALNERREREKRLLEVFEDERETQRKEAERLAVERLEQQQRCAFARELLARYRTARYLYEQDEQGNRDILPDEERAAAEADAERAVDQHCK